MKTGWAWLADVPGPVADTDLSTLGGFPVVLSHKGRTLAAARSRHLFGCGIELTVERVALPVGTRLELEFRWRDRLWQVPAEVAFQNGPLVGAVFRGAQIELVAELARRREEAPRAAPIGLFG